MSNDDDTVSIDSPSCDWSSGQIDGRRPTSSIAQCVKGQGLNHCVSLKFCFKSAVSQSLLPAMAMTEIMARRPLLTSFILLLSICDWRGGWGVQWPCQCDGWGDGEGRRRDIQWPCPCDRWAGAVALMKHMAMVHCRAHGRHRGRSAFTSGQTRQCPQAAAYQTCKNI
jgi:hypothetical protein